MAGDARRFRAGGLFDLGCADGGPTMAAARHRTPVDHGNRAPRARSGWADYAPSLCDGDLHERISDTPCVSLRHFLSPTTDDTREALDLLTRVLDYAVGNDAPDVARALMADAMNFARAVATPPEQIVSLTRNPAAAEFLALLVEAFNHTTEAGLRAPDVHPTAELVSFFVMHRLSLEPVEVLYALFFNATGSLIHERELARGSFSHCLPSPPGIARIALTLGAAAVVLAHNHPSGIPDPSAHDVRFSADVAASLALADAVLVDHLIVANGTVASMRKLGCLPPETVR
jgi:DNA repair protein RadC